MYKPSEGTSMDPFSSSMVKSVAPWILLDQVLNLQELWNPDSRSEDDSSKEWRACKCKASVGFASESNNLEVSTESKDFSMGLKVNILFLKYLKKVAALL